MLKTIHLRLLGLCLSIEFALSTTDGTAAVPKAAAALDLHATAFLNTPNEWGFYAISGVTYDNISNLWTGVSEGNLGVTQQLEIEAPRLFGFEIDWAPYKNESFSTESSDTVIIVSKEIVEPGDGLKCEGIVQVPTVQDFAAPEFWIVSESNSNTQKTNSYFTKRFGLPDINTFVPNTVRPSRFIRVASNGLLREEISLPDFLVWDGGYDWDPRKCYGTRVLQGLHALTLLEEPADSSRASQLISASQSALYQDGPTPTIFDGSQVRILFWDVLDNDPNSPPTVQYSRAYRYETSRLLLDTFQKGASHVRGVFGILSISRTELLVTESEWIEGMGIDEFIGDVFYVKFGEGDTVDHCMSLLDEECDVPVAEKRHLLRTKHPYEISDLAWGPSVERDGVTLPTVAISYENDAVVGILMELYIWNSTQIRLEPLWENNKSSRTFLTKRIAALVTAIAFFVAGIIGQWCWAKNLKKRETLDSPAQVAIDDEQNDPRSIHCGMQYSNYILASSVVNSTLLGGLVFGFPGLVLILRRTGVFAEVCSCGSFCAGQQEKLALLSTVGFAASIGSRLLAGLFLDRFGPKITSVCAGTMSSVGLLVLATSGDVLQLSNRITPAWVILAVGGSAIHLTSFHVTNLQENTSKKSQASVYVSAGFGAGSLILPILQVINQFGDIRLQTICAYYAGVSILLTINSFFHQPWRAWNAIGSQPSFDMKCFRRAWWPEKDGLRKLTPAKQSTDTKFPPLKVVLKSFTFWGECFWFSCQLFLLTYYLSTINQILFSLGDTTVNQNVDSLYNNMFSRAAVFFNGLGFLWTPLVAHLLKTKTLYFRIHLEIAMAFVMAMLLTIPIIEVQVIVFLMQALVRLQVFTYHFAYVADRFGFRHFGLLNGISSLIAGLFGLLGYMLQMFSVYVTRGNFGISYFIVAALILCTVLFPLVQRRLDLAEVQASNDNGDKKDEENHVAEQISLLSQSENGQSEKGAQNTEEVGFDTNPDASPQTISMNQSSIPEGTARNERNDNVLLEQSSSMSNHEDTN